MGEEQRSSSRVLRIIGLVIAVLALAACGAFGVATVALPGCAGCHFRTPGFEAPTVSTSHATAGTSCVACHVETNRLFARAKFGLYEAFGMWVPLLDTSSTDATVVKDSQCLACHQDVAAQMVEAGGIRIAHASCAAGRTCVDCHSEVGHAAATPWPLVFSMNDCTTCHRTMKVSLSCETCHTGKMLVERSSKPEFGVTHGPTWRLTHGMGQMSSCSVCHAEDSCARCHGPGVPHAANFVLLHAELSTQTGAQCLSCHEDAFCYSCHLTEMPHPKAFVTTHSTTVKTDGQEPCLRCHVTTDCDTCHVKHVHPGGAVGGIPSPSRGDQ